jgi:hypothetical protein
MNIKNKYKIDNWSEEKDFLRLKNIKLFRKTEGNSEHICEFLSL